MGGLAASASLALLNASYPEYPATGQPLLTRVFKRSSFCVLKPAQAMHPASGGVCSVTVIIY
jgi:hypothetical protein